MGWTKEDREGLAGTGGPDLDRGPGPPAGQGGEGRGKCMFIYKHIRRNRAECHFGAVF